MTKHIGARDARNSFSEIMGHVHYGGQVVIVERSGKPMVAVIPVEMYEQLVLERDVRFEVLERIRSGAPDVSPAETMRDIAEAVAAVRTVDAQGSP